MKIYAALTMGLCMMTAGIANAADRFPPLAIDRMTPEQKKVADAIASGPRKSLSGPFNAWLRSPELANRFQEIQKDLAAKGVKTLITMGSYNHRFIARTTTFSRHSYGTAIDISGFIFRDGKKRDD